MFLTLGYMNDAGRSLTGLSGWVEYLHPLQKEPTDE